MLVLLGLAGSVLAAGWHDLEGWGAPEGELAAKPEPRYRCSFFNPAEPGTALDGTDYGDANITVRKAEHPGTHGGSAACCAVCAAYNAEKAAVAPNCTVVVYHVDSGVCALKATANQPMRGRHVVASQPLPLPLPPDPSAMQLIILPNASSVDRGAMCLDGTPPAVYFRAANTTADPDAARKWVVYFKGGGWCYNETACAARAGSLIGSSSALESKQPTFTFTGPLDTNATANPDFAHFNHVVLWYCDGGSFSGDRTTPVVVDGQQLWFRGRRNLDAMLDFLDDEHGLADATEVLLSGGSAGGLSTYLHADYVRSRFAPSIKFRAAPISGFFLNHATVDGAPVYMERMRYVFSMMNSTGGVNQGCVQEAKGSGGEWQCIFANASYAFTQTPIFPLNSAVDAWQMGNVFDMAKDCASDQFAGCSPAQVEQLDGYERDFLHDMLSSPTFQKPGNGGFIESCLEHCAAQSSRTFTTIAIGGTTMQQALSAWWNAPESAPAKEHWHLPCKLSAEPPHMCNPTCG